MTLVYVTGLSGSGKSAVLREVNKRGFEARGVDEEGFADWIDRETGEVAPFPHDDPTLDIHDWYAKHRWVLSEERIAKVKKDADQRNRIVFLAGVAEGEQEVWHFFDKVIALSVDEATVRNRIESRQDNRFGKNPEEMAEVLSWLENYDETYRGFGALVIDATKPLDRVVDEILEAVQADIKAQVARDMDA